MRETSFISAVTERSRVLIANPVFNAVWFDALWFCLVVGREKLVWASLALLAFHLLLVHPKRHEYGLLLTVAGVGIAVDSLLTLTGIFVFADAWLLPWWLTCLWVGFAATVTRSLSFLNRRRWLAVMVGAIAGPVSYGAGYSLGAVTFGLSPTATLMLLSALWAGLLPALLALGDWQQSAGQY